MSLCIQPGILTLLRPPPPPVASARFSALTYIVSLSFQCNTHKTQHVTMMMMSMSAWSITPASHPLWAYDYDDHYYIRHSTLHQNRPTIIANTVCTQHQHKTQIISLNTSPRFCDEDDQNTRTHANRYM